MAINISIYSNGNTATKTVSFDFQSSILASSFDYPVGRTALDHYIVAKSSAKQEDNSSLPTQAIVSLADLALLGSGGNSHAQVSTTAAYANVTALVEDYLYDYVYGHEDNQHSTGVSEQQAMKFD